MTKKKLLYIIFGAIAAVLAIAGVVVAFLLNYDQVVPSKVEIVANECEVFFKSDYNENYHGYRFSFQSANSSFTYDSESNVVSLTQIEDKVIAGRNYQISSCFLGDNEGGNSKFSEPVSWTSYQFLEKPELEYDEDRNILSWNSVKNADYYKVYYKDTEINKSENFFDLSQLEGGEYKFSVAACSNLTEYKFSTSAEIEISHIKKFRAFESMEFDKETFTLTLIGRDKLNLIEIMLENENLRVENFDLKYEQGKYKYTIDLKLKYNGQTRIGARPVGRDKFNVYEGQFVYLFT